MLDRMIRAARLDVNLYEEVEHDSSLTRQALQVVILISVLSGIGAFISGLLGGESAGIGRAVIGLLVDVVASIIGWAIWAWVTYFVGTRIFGGTATWGEVLRTTGYAYAPHALSFFAFIPCLGGILSLIGFVWTIVAGVIAVRQALDFSTSKAIMTVVIAGVLMFVVVFVPLMILGIGAMALGGAAR